MYEEEITTPSDTTPPYISYYTLGGKLVGLRRANQTSDNGQYRVVGDHLGSTSLLVNTAATPTVVQRTYYKPYGEVAWSWSSSGGGSTYLTSVGYTGQRLEAESGLMHYGARFYDPVLSFFVSADAIAADRREPETRNRYSYVLNNPLKYTDPTGHQAEPTSTSPSDSQPPHPRGDCATGDVVKQMECQLHAQSLSWLGLEVEDLGAWNLRELALVTEAIATLLRVANWDIEDFKEAMGIGPEGSGRPHDKILLRRRTDVRLDNGGYVYGNSFKPGARSSLTGGACPPGRAACIDYHDIAFRDKSPEGELLALRTIVHELGHIWDNAHNLQAGMPAENGPTYDFADAVALVVYPKSDPEFSGDYPNSVQYVRDKFRQFSRCERTPGCQPYPPGGAYPPR